MHIRLDQLLAQKGLVPTRSQAEHIIKLGKVTVGGRVVTKPGHFVGPAAEVGIAATEHYVSRAGLKLASVSQLLGLNFNSKTVLDVGSSTGGFTDYALQHGATKVIAVDVGTDQLHPRLRSDVRIELHEKTDIRDFVKTLHTPVDVVVIDVSFISLREILPAIVKVCGATTQVVAMVKPQFEAGRSVANKGVIKNDRVRRQVLHDFEGWVKSWFVIKNKADSAISGVMGNRERFYLLNLPS